MKSDFDRVSWEKLNLKITDEYKFASYLKIFPIKRILLEYAKPFFNEELCKFHDNTTSEQIIELIEFDRNLATKMQKAILYFERKLKNIIISTWTKYYNLNNPLIYNFTKEKFLQFLPQIEKVEDLEYSKFTHSLFEYAPLSEFLLEFTSLKHIPIEELSYSWSFATIINFYRVLDPEVQKIILEKLKINPSFYNIFHKMLNVILKVRNMIAHNNPIYNIKVSLYRVEFNKIFCSLKKWELSSSENVSIDKICSFIDYIIELPICADALKNELRQSKLNNTSKEYIIKLVYGLI